jgi:inner membrane protein involved in colicin E2 resistance
MSNRNFGWATAWKAIRAAAALAIATCQSLVYGIAFGNRPFGFYIAAGLTLAATIALCLSLRNGRWAAKFAGTTLLALFLVLVIKATRHTDEFGPAVMVRPDGTIVTETHLLVQEFAAFAVILFVVALLTPRGLGKKD